MPDLGNTAPATTYPYLLQIDGGLDTALRPIEDGDGTNLPIQISTTEVSIDDGIEFTLLGGLISFNGGGDVVKLGKVNTGDEYTIYLPSTIPSAINKFLKVSAISSDTITLSWDVQTSDALLLGGGTISSTLQNVTDKAASGTALYIATNKVRSNGNFSIVGQCQLYRSGADHYISHECSSSQNTDYSVVWPSAIATDAVNRMLRVSGVNLGTGVVTLSWGTVGSDVALLASSNTFAGEQVFNAGFALTAGGMRIRAIAVSTNVVSLTNTSHPIQAITPSPTNCIVLLPDTSVPSYLTFFISHTGSSLNVIVKNGATTVKTMTAGQKFFFIYDGSDWMVA